MQRYLLAGWSVGTVFFFALASINQCDAQEPKKRSTDPQFGDPNSLELDQIGREAKEGLFAGQPLVVNGYRHPMDKATELEKVAFQNALDNYDVDIDTVQVSYVVSLRDVKHRIYIGFAVKSKRGKSHFLISDPVSTLGRKFHERFADQYRIGNADLPSRTPSAIRVLRERMQDVNLLEVTQIKRELESDPMHFGGKPLMPTGPRRPFTDSNMAALDDVKRLYDVDLAAEDVLYVRPLQDVVGRQYTGFAVKSKKNSQFLISSGRTKKK